MSSPRLLVATLLVLQLVCLASGRMYKKCELARELKYVHGLPDHQISTWVCIAKHESSYNTSAVNYGSGDHGLFQISDVYWCSMDGPGKSCSKACQDFEDDDISDDMECVKTIFNEHTRLSGDGFTAWVVYPTHCRGDTSSYIAGCFDQAGNTATDLGYQFNGFDNHVHGHDYHTNTFGGGTHNFGVDTSNYGVDTSNYGVDTTNYGTDNNYGLGFPSFGVSTNNFRVNNHNNFNLRRGFKFYGGSTSGGVLSANYRNNGDRFKQVNEVQTTMSPWRTQYQSGNYVPRLPAAARPKNANAVDRNIFFYQYYPDKQPTIPQRTNNNRFNNYYW